MKSVCTKFKCGWRSVELGFDLPLAHGLASAHTMLAHPAEYLMITGRDSVPVMSLATEMELSLYTDWEFQL